MKQIFKKTIALILSCPAALGFVACGDKENSSSGAPSTGKVLDVHIINLGYGTKWLSNIADEYKKVTGNTVKITSFDGMSGVTSLDDALDSGRSTADLVFTKRSTFVEDMYVESKRIEEDITSVWTSANDYDGGAKIIDKMNKDYTDYFNFDDKYYALPWAGGAFGIVLNEVVWEDIGYTDEDIPLTTDEMFAICDEIKAKSAQTWVYPFFYEKTYPYYASFTPIWFAQYEGVENMAKFNAGLDEDGQETSNVYNYVGQEESLKIFEKLLKESNGYQFSTFNSFAEMQDEFVAGDRDIRGVFCVNGSWLGTESGGTENIKFIKTPVISAIVNKFDAASTKTDAKLAEVIRYIDAGETGTKPTGVTDNDIKIVREARNYAYLTSGMDHQAMVLNYRPEDKKELAKDFLQFMYSDTGLKIYYKTQAGIRLPAKLASGQYSDDSSVKQSLFVESVNDIMDEGCLFTAETKCRLFSVEKISPIFQNGVGGSIVDILAKGDMTAVEIIEANINKLKQELGQ